MSLTIKASLYHNWNHHPIETRRFSIDQEVATSFTYLMQKLAQIFPDVEADKITVAYIDSDGDRVTISTDDELTEALSQFDGSIFRIRLKKKESLNNEYGQDHLPPPWFGLLNSYLKGVAGGNPFQSFFGSASQENNQDTKEESEAKANPDEQPSTNKEGESPNGSSRGVYHPGVICDGCSGSIYGKRYKCCQCPDYDLCEGCEGKGLHTDHDMYTIDKPACRPPWMGGPRGPGCHHAGQHPGAWGGHLGPFEFKLWGHPGRCGPWSAGHCGGSWPQGCNERCPGRQQQPQQTEEKSTTGVANDDMETQQETEFEKEPMAEQ